MDEIKQKKIELNKDEINISNNKKKDDRLNMILSVTDRNYQFSEYKSLPDKQPNKLKLPK